MSGKKSKPTQRTPRKGTPAKVSLDSNSENILISLIALLDNDDAGIVGESTASNTVNKLIRDDRLSSKLQRLELESKRLQMKEKRKEAFRATSLSESLADDFDQDKKSSSGISKSLRIQLTCSALPIKSIVSSPYSDVKIVVIDRSTDQLETILNTMRNKFRLAKKFNILFDVHGGNLIETNEQLRLFLATATDGCLLDIRCSFQPANLFTGHTRQSPESKLIDATIQRAEERDVDVGGLLASESGDVANKFFNKFNAIDTSDDGDDDDIHSGVNLNIDGDDNSDVTSDCEQDSDSSVDGVKKAFSGWYIENIMLIFFIQLFRIL